MANALAGDLILLVSPERKRYLIRLQPGSKWYSHRGSIAHDDIIGQPLGRSLYTEHGYAYLALEPSTADLIADLPRTTQIIYPKDAAQIVMRLNLYSGRRVVEAGTGSAGLTLVLARAVMPAGHVYSYETRPESFTTAYHNIEDLQLLPNVTLRNEDVSNGFHETDMDACFLDMREPWRFLDHVWNTLKGSGFFGALVPTVNQVSELVAGLQARPFGDICVEELLVRGYKLVPARLRPEDRMIAHSGFLIFARKIAREDESLSWIPDKKRRQFIGKQAMLQREAAQREAEAIEEIPQSDDD